MQPEVTQRIVALLQRIAVGLMLWGMADWEDYRYAAAVAEAGTVRGAAKLLGVNASTVTRRIDHFERRLGVSLFVRSVRGLVPTAAGRGLVAALQDVGQQLEDVERRLRRGGSEMAGEISLSVSPVVAARLFMPAVVDLLAEFPAMSVQQRSRWTVADLETHDVDIALVVVDQPPGDLIGRPGGVMSMAAWANQELHSRWPKACRWLPSRLQQETAPDYVVDGVAAGGMLDTPELQIAAVRTGLGASLLPWYELHGDPQLVELPLPRVHPEVWVLSHPHTRGVRRVQLLASRLADALRNTDLRATQ